MCLLRPTVRLAMLPAKIAVEEAPEPVVRLKVEVDHDR